MNTIGALAIGAFALVAATGASAASRQSQNASDSQVLQAPAPPSTQQPGEVEVHPLFAIGDLPVGVWAPVEPPYNANMNRNQAANPIWSSESPL
jgi:hypothetical protein